ncbi:MAG: protoheme IX farnesyltransferase [Myxococcales bacterium]|nr:protoheme IX farnesyltransferase [Myxococcales bacterium]MCB9708898.1 protoheme IX farnesyltransferase [Myxococcales bacterium]
MYDALSALATHPNTLRDIIALSKPRITLMVVLTTACGIWLAPVDVGIVTALVTIGATAGLVSAAGMLNCWLEIDVDARMSRTAKRPLPAGRVHPDIALTVGLMLGVGSVLALCFLVNALTGLLGALALFIYVCVYTPLKLKSPKALLVGAVPGAMPPLMGWTAATNSIDLAALCLFGVLFFWQMPHFIAISVFRKQDYMRAGVKVVPWVRGERAAVVHAVAYSLLLWISSVALYVVGPVGHLYGVAALLVGGMFFFSSLRGMWQPDLNRWSKQVFWLSLVFVTVLFPVMALSAA